MAYAEQRGKKFRGRYRDANGDLQTAVRADGCRSFTSKREARQLAEEEEAKIRRGDWLDPRAGTMPFSVYFEEHWLPNRIQELNTAKTYRSHYNATLKAEFGHLQVKAIQRPLIQRWVVRMQKAGIPAGTVEAKFKALQTILAAQEGVSAVFDGLINQNPCKGVTLPPVDKREVNVYEVEESDRLVAALDPWWRPIPILASESGMRWGELMGLRVGDFADGYRVVTVTTPLLEASKADTENGTSFLFKPRPKGRKPRTFALQPRAAAMVEEMVRDRQLFGGDRLFSMPDRRRPGLPARPKGLWAIGQPIYRRYFNQVWKTAHEASGVDANGRRFHDLRGSHITWLLAGGADPATVMKRVGQRQMETMMKYVTALADADQRALDALAATQARYRETS